MSEPFESTTMRAPIKIIGQAATRVAPTRMAISRLRTPLEINLTGAVPRNVVVGRDPLPSCVNT